MRSASLLAAILLGAPAVAVQDPLFTTQGSETYGKFGGRLDGGADVDGDGHTDLLAADIYAGVQGTGAVSVLSGQDGHVLHVFVGDGLNDLFGIDAQFAGDADADGVPDIVASARAPVLGPGYARLYSGANWQPLHTLPTLPEDGTHAGIDSVDGLGDVDGDGHSDIGLVVQTNDYMPHHYRIYSGASGTLLYGEAIDYASIIRGVGDTDADGTPDFVVGHPESSLAGQFAGCARLHSGTDGALLRLWTGDAPWDHFAEAVDGAGDVNDDGHADVVIGTDQWGPIDDGPGYVRVFSGLDGGVLREWHGDQPNDAFGWSVAHAGDVDADGLPELLIGAGRDTDIVHVGGSVRVQSGLDGSLLFQLSQGAVPFTGATGGAFGQAVCTAGDADADGLADVAFSDPSGKVSGSSTGTVWGFSGRHFAWHGVPQTVDVASVLSACGVLEADGKVTMMLTGAPSKSPVVLVLGLGQLGVPFQGGTWIPTPDVLLPAGITMGPGGLALHGHVPGTLTAGIPLVMQAWTLSATGILGSNGVQTVSR